MTTIKTVFAIVFPALVGSYLAMFDEFGINAVLFIVAFITSTLGSMMQITHKNLETKVSRKEIYAIYTTGVVMGIVAYVVGDWQQSLIVTMGLGVFGSYMSLDLFKYLKLAVIAIIKKLPNEILDAVLERYLKNKNHHSNYYDGRDRPPYRNYDDEEEDFYNEENKEL